MLADLRFALRSLRRSPVFAISTVLTLALGVGANAGAYSAVYALLLKPLPYPEPERLVSLYETNADRQPRGVAEGNLLDWRSRTHAFDAMAVYQPRSFGLTLRDSDRPRVIQTGMVMAEFFRVLGVRPAMGRVFGEEEEFAEGHLAVLSDRLWRSDFMADPGVIGRKVFLNEAPFTVVGVMPAGFEYPMDRVLPDAFIPLSHRDYCCARLGSQSGIARVRSGVGLERARSELEAAAASLASEYPATNAGRTAGFRPLDAVVTGNRREPLLMLAAVALLMLGIACANVTGLLLARLVARSQELSIRVSLGAGLAQLARQFLAEAAVLSGAAAMAGLGAARGVLWMVPQFVPGGGLAAPLRLDAGAFGAALVVALGVTGLLTAAPTLWARRAEFAVRGRGRVRGALVLTQVALSVVLLLSTGLLLRSFFLLLATNPGFDTAHAWEFGIGLPDQRYDTTLKEITFHRALTDRLSKLPGVEAVGAVARLPLRVNAGQGSFQLWGANLPGRQWPRSAINAATPGYFAAMGIPVREGRDFSWRDDRPGVHRVAVVNEAFVRQYLRGRRAVGTRLDVHWVSDLNPAGVPWEIVGVTGDTRQANLESEPAPEIFLSISQVGLDGGGYVVRTRVRDAGMVAAIAKAVEEQDPRIERPAVKPLDFVMDRALASRTGTLRLLGGFAGLALLLTAVGIYGMVAFRAAGRAREMAIRAALGAGRQDIRNLVLGQAVRLAVYGIAAGLLLFLAASPLWKAQLFGVGPGDPVSIVVVAGVVMLVAMGAALGPSWRASRAQPADLLRER